MQILRAEGSHFWVILYLPYPYPMSTGSEPCTGSVLNTHAGDQPPAKLGLSSFKCWHGGTVHNIPLSQTLCWCNPVLLGYDLAMTGRKG
jgi:hypothetical protein